MTGCCSVIMQLERNDSAVSFRRDAGNFADLTIEEQNWHWQKVLKQYKESQEYFVQVIVTSDGWVLTYGGKDDGVDNQKIENISREMVKNKSSTIDIYASNDDRSMWNLKDASGADNFYYNRTFYDKKDIPIAPEKEYVATHEFEKTQNKEIDFNAIIPPLILIVIGGPISSMNIMLGGNRKSIHPQRQSRKR